jgi:plasmid segregation protein ParM
MTKAEANAPKTVIFAGCDDGHDSIKLEIRIVTEENSKITASQEGFHLTMPSKVVRGSRAVALVDDDTSSGSGIYRVPTENGGEEAFTVTDALGGNDLIDTRSINYPISSVNRVLVHDALLRAKLGGKEVHLVTGLPVSGYYNDTGTNKPLIEQKRANLLTGPVTPLVKTVKTATIIEHLIACEGISAVYDMAIRDDGTDDPDFFKLLEQAPVGVIDIGGKTIDLAVVYLDRGHHQVDRSRTKSINYGMLRLMNSIRSEIAAVHNVTDISPRAMFKILTDGTIWLSGENVDVSNEVKTAMAKELPDLFERIRSVWGKAEDLVKVIVVGGGAYLLADEIKKGLYRHAESRKDPEYANARGMLKMSMRNYLGRQLRESKE